MTQGSNIQVGAVTRREFLNYVWASSMALFVAGAGGVGWLFALPHSLRTGLNIGPKYIPNVGDPPISVPDSEVFITRVAEGVIALNRHCTHQGCVMPYSESEDRFVCPCHGVQYTRTGDYIAGPAPRNMDWYPLRVLAHGDTPEAYSTSSGAPVPYTPGAALKIDMEHMRLGRLRDQMSDVRYQMAEGNSRTNLISDI